MPQDHPEDPMHTDAVEETQSTQQATQETQLMSQIDGSVDEHLWGMLIPCNANLHRIDFQKVKRVYSVGRNDDSSRGGNDIVFPGMKISNYHCRIEWDGQKGPKSAVKVTDLSSNGTFINQQKIGKNMTRLLYDGNELSFGTWQPQFGATATQDYRFVFRHLAAAATLRGIFKYYQLHETLGTGSFATVTKAIHRETGVWYAVKTMERKRLRTASNAQAHNDAAFSREINILEDLQHPRICGLKEVFYEEHTINLILELIQGGDLLDYILDSENQRLTESLSQHITYQICDALQYIHSKGIAHRDLKPENVLLTRDNPPLVKVADFGLAKAVDSMTMLRTMCGTPSYLAPEVVLQKNCDGYDHLVDSWSVGVIVFCMLTGSNPFPDETGELAARVLSREVDWDCFQTTCPSHAARDFIERLLEFSPQTRMPPSSSLEHPWLIPYRWLAANVPLGNAIPPADSQYSQSAHFDAAEDDNANADADASMDSGHAETNGGDSQMHEEPPVGSQLPGLPGAYPQSQQLQRRSVALLQQLQQERGEEEVVVSEDEGVGEDEPVGPLVRGTKRKAALVFEGSLTPMEEEEEDPNAMPVSPRAVRTAPAHGRKARGAAGPSTQPPRANTTRGGRNAAGTTPNGTRRSERLVNGPAGRHRK
ncbi:Pkinase-domain-containing protein [Rhodofomes roseus]|uniref:Pkinase-domain-containing protein n=1 Tax=Rhodofomes roseus TaxID=34475 RepID=A0ABQ8KL46_9APHY|nr:Pkinase-domain-containing protein [Rhodofomes roseus]KAH9838995.1 Pkinase-domain-containing protein [Rhodofomes roseus]